MKKNQLLLTVESMAILVGTIVSAGIFVLPYINIRSGLLATNVWLILLGILVCVLHLIFGEIVLRTKGDYKLPGYAGIYLGKTVKRFFGFASVLTLAFSLLIFIIMVNNFVQILFFQHMAYLKPYSFVLVWFLLNLFLFFKYAKVSKCNFFLTFVLIGLMGVVSFLCISKIDFSSVLNFSRLLFTKDFYASYGVVFFSFDGLVAMPIMFSLLRSKKAAKKVFKRSVILAFAFVVALYFVFMNAISLLSRGSTSIDAISGLAPFFGPVLVLIGSILGILAISTGYITFSFYYKEMLQSDFKISNAKSILITMFLPLVFLLLGATKVDDLMSLTGGIMGGLVGIIILFVYKKAKETSKVKPAYSLNLPNWSLVVIGGIWFLGSMSQVFLRMIK